MSITGRIILCLFTIGFCLFIAPRSARACTCDLPRPGKTLRQEVIEARGKSKAIFSGKVIEVIENPQAFYVEVRFKIQRMWQQVSTDEIIIRTGRGDGDCGYPFEVGESYLVYAYGSDESKLETNICQRTRRLADAGEDLNLLGNGKTLSSTQQVTAQNHSDKTVKVQAEIDGGVIKSEDIQIEIRVNERIITPQITKGEFSADVLGWVDENERDIAVEIKYKRYELKLLDLSKDHFQGRWTISITTAPHLDKRDLPNAENVDYTYMVEFMPINGEGIAISNVKYKNLPVAPSAQPSYRTIIILAEIDGKPVKSEKLKVELSVDKKPVFPQITGDELSLSLPDSVDEDKRDVVLKITYKRYELEFSDLSKDHFRGQWKVFITTAPHLDTSDLPNAENIDYAYGIEFQSGNSLGTVLSNLKYKNLLTASPITANAHRDNIKAKVAEAVALYPQKAKAASENLQALGVEAIPSIVEIIKDNDSILKPPQIKKIAQTKKTTQISPFLIGVIAYMPGKQADTALIGLLSSKDVIIRGSAATALGKRKFKAAIPSLIELLNDSKVYQVYVASTHQSGSATFPTSEVNVLIRDVAVDALEEITGTVLAESDNKRAQAKAWRRWWKKQQKSNQNLMTKS